MRVEFFKYVHQIQVQIVYYFISKLYSLLLLLFLFHFRVLHMQCREGTGLEGLKDDLEADPEAIKIDLEGLEVVAEWGPEPGNFDINIT